MSCRRGETDNRYILNMNVMDETSNLWVTGFNEIGEQVLGMTADALTHLKEEDEAKALRVFNRACTKQFTLQMMGKPDTYNVSFVISTVLTAGHCTRALFDPSRE